MHIAQKLHSGADMNCSAVLLPLLRFLLPIPPLFLRPLFYVPSYWGMLGKRDFRTETLTLFRDRRQGYKTRIKTKIYDKELKKDLRKGIRKDPKKGYKART